MYRVLPKSELPALVRDWMKEAAVYGPVGRPDPVSFKRIDDPSGVLSEAAFLNTTYPPKALFLPQSEVLMKASADGRLDPILDDGLPMVVLGIRPCDVRALHLLDGVFLGGVCSDPYWRARREKATLVALACSDPCRSCFCTAVGLGPFDARGSDALLIEQERDYLVQIVTERGKKLFGRLENASSARIDEAQRSSRKAAAAMASPISKPFSVQGESIPLPDPSIPPNIKDRLYALYESEFWARIQQACIGCGVCTYLCPTCHCFDIVDESQRGERVRNWDTCMFRIYSQEASGHNPRPSNLKRVRNRIMHKYAYFPERQGAFGCTGCGRCVRLCPVNIDLREMVQYALEFKLA